MLLGILIVIALHLGRVEGGEAEVEGGSNNNHQHFPIAPHHRGNAEERAAVEALFNEFDLNHDGLLDRIEFGHGYQTHPSFQGASSWTSWFFGNADTSTENGDDGKQSFWSGLTSAICMIIATEIGDKTFFIAAVLSMKQDRRAVFAGAMGALALMTVLSTAMGLILPQLLSRQYTHILSGILFAYFGFKLYWDSRSMKAHAVSDELEEVEEELASSAPKKKKKTKMEDDGNDSNGDSLVVETIEMDDDAPQEQDLESNPIGSSTNTPTLRGRTASSKKSSATPKKKISAPKRRTKRIKKASGAKKFLNIAVQSFTLTFVAEWGDRSQFATVALAAAKDPYGVTIGGCLGHFLCTGLAVMGGRMLAAQISEKTVSQWGAAIFGVFAIHSLFFEE